MKPAVAMRNVFRRATVVQVCMKHYSRFCIKVSPCISLITDFSVVCFLLDKYWIIHSLVSYAITSGI